MLNYYFSRRRRFSFTKTTDTIHFEIRWGLYRANSYSHSFHRIDVSFLWNKPIYHLGNENPFLTLFVPGSFIPTFDRGWADLRTTDIILTGATAVLKFYSVFTEVFPLWKKHIHSFNSKTNFLETVLNQTGEKKKWNNVSRKELSKIGIFF